ncbi:hypothetical protein FF1_011418 [Malus domestica]
MVENLQLAHQELFVIIDLINTVKTNNVVTMASMTRPKPLPNETMSDLAVNMENAMNAGDMENAESELTLLFSSIMHARPDGLRSFSRAFY